ncbi:MAG: acyl-CoA dehydrogenase family protein [Gammaproteobacteria bacterium]
MEFGLAEDQLLMGESLRRALNDYCTLDTIRSIVSADEFDYSELWLQLAELGITGLMVDERHGGSGLGFVDAALVIEILSAFVAPVPFAGSCVAAPFALSHGPTDLQAEWLPQIAAGSKTVGVGIAEHTGTRENAGVGFIDGQLHGRCLFVTDIYADAFLVATTDQSVVLIASDALGLEKIPLISIDKTRPLGELVFTGVAPVAIVADDSHVLNGLIDVMRVMSAADTLGAAQYMLDAAVAYAAQREQFGRVIASFQAVKHLCAEMAAELEPCRAMVWYAAHALQSLPGEAHLYACQTKAHVSEVGTFVAKTATEVHGGVGFTDLLGLHYWFKRIGLNRQLFGSPERAREDAARAQGII